MTSNSASRSVFGSLYKSFLGADCERVSKVFLETQDEAAYNNMVAFILNWKNSLAPQQAINVSAPIPGLRIVVTDPDGTVALDTAKTNTWANYKAKTINENHNTRTYNIGAAMSNDGVFYQEKYSNSVGRNLVYYAIRLGFTSYRPIGNIIISMNE